MKLENRIENQMGSPFCYIKWVAAVLVLSLSTFAGLGGFCFLSVILMTSMVLILSTLFFTLTKQKPAGLVQKSVREEGLIESDDHQEIMMSSSSPPSIEDHVVPTLLLLQQQQQQQQLPHQSEITAQQHKEEEPQKGIETDQHDHRYSIRSSPDLLSSESDHDQSLDDHLSTSEDSEVEWPFRDIVYQSPDCSDGSISDEESLIEIALPSGHYVDHNKEEEEEEQQQQQQEEPYKFNHIQQKMPADFLPQSILKQHSLMELLAELHDINEEDNLIEIDISMGSIKCSRFEIEA